MTEDYVTARAEAERALHDAKRRLAAEISAYPGPVSGCDAQFNHLLAERRRLDAALAALGSDVFIATPRCLAPGEGVESR